MRFAQLPKPRTPGGIYHLACAVAVLRDQLEEAGVWPWRASGVAIAMPYEVPLRMLSPYGTLDIYAHPMCGEATIITVAIRQGQTTAHQLAPVALAGINEVMRVDAMQGRSPTEALVSPRTWATLNSLMVATRDFAASNLQCV